MQIRKAGLNDIDTLIAMRELFIQDVHPDTPLDKVVALRSTVADHFGKYLSHSIFAYLAVVDTEAAAVVFLSVTERPANLRIPSGKLGTILNVYTKPAYRRRGLVSALLKEALSDARQMGLSVIELQATEAGRKVYEKLGFTVATTSDTPMEYRIIP